MSDSSSLSRLISRLDAHIEDIGSYWQCPIRFESTDRRKSRREAHDGQCKSKPPRDDLREQATALRKLFLDLKSDHCILKEPWEIMAESLMKALICTDHRPLALELLRDYAEKRGVPAGNGQVNGEYPSSSDMSQSNPRVEMSSSNSGVRPSTPTKHSGSRSTNFSYAGSPTSPTASDFSSPTSSTISSVFSDRYDNRSSETPPTSQSTAFYQLDQDHPGSPTTRKSRPIKKAMIQMPTEEGRSYFESKQKPTFLFKRDESQKSQVTQAPLKQPEARASVPTQTVVEFSKKKYNETTKFHLALIIEKSLGKRDKMDGLLYIARYENQDDTTKDLYKLGWTKNSVHHRYNSGCPTKDELKFLYRSPQHFFGAYRVEALVHAELCLERRHIKNCKGCKGSHNEWFHADIDTLYASVNRWSWFVQLPAYNRDGTLSDKGMKVLHQLWTWDKLTRSMATEMGSPEHLLFRKMTSLCCEESIGTPLSQMRAKEAELDEENKNYQLASSAGKSNIQQRSEVPVVREVEVDGWEAYSTSGDVDNTEKTSRREDEDDESAIFIKTEKIDTPCVSNIEKISCRSASDDKSDKVVTPQNDTKIRTITIRWIPKRSKTRVAPRKSRGGKRTTPPPPPQVSPPATGKTAIGDNSIPTKQAEIVQPSEESTKGGLQRRLTGLIERVGTKKKGEDDQEKEQMPRKGFQSRLAGLWGGKLGWF